MNQTADSFQYTAEKITEMCDTWANFNGFEGDTCGECKRTANVLSGGAGWICVCGHYNMQGFHGGMNRPHNNPDLGPTTQTIQEGISKSARWQKLIDEIKPKHLTKESALIIIRSVGFTPDDSIPDFFNRGNRFVGLGETALTVTQIPSKSLDQYLRPGNKTLVYADTTEDELRVYLDDKTILVQPLLDRAKQ